MRISRFTALAAIGFLGALACGSTSSGGGGGGGTISIGVELPMSGSESSNGVPTLNGVKFAVSQQGTLDGFTLKVVSKDDAPTGTHDPAVGAANVRSLLADASVMGMIGPFNSNVAKAEIPIANVGHLSMISPSNTNPCLTKDLPACSNPLIGYHPQDLRKGQPNNYFRDAGTDDHQGAFTADYAYDTLGLRNVGVISDNETYGVGIALYFAQEFCAKGGTVAGGCANQAGVENTDTSSQATFSALINKLKSEGAQAIYFGGVNSLKACVIRNQETGILDPATTAYMGGDGIVNQGCLDDAAAAAPGIFATTAACDVSQCPPSAQTVVDQFKRAYPNNNDYGSYTLAAYAATKALIAAIDQAIKANGGNMPTREQVRDALGHLNAAVDSPIGPVKFTPDGDITPTVITLYKSVPYTDALAKVAPACSTAKTVCYQYVTQGHFS